MKCIWGTIEGVEVHHGCVAGRFDEDSNLGIGVCVYNEGRKRKDEFIVFRKLRAAFVA